MILKLNDGKLFDTTKGERWAEARDWDGRNMVGRSSGSQWRAEALYRTSKGRWVVVTTSRVEGEADSARLLSRPEAAAWLILNECAVPADLEAAATDVVE